MSEVKRCYLSGPMRGVHDLNRPAFNAAAEKLRKDGWQVFNPASANLEGWELRRIFAIELEWICREADAIAMLPGWEDSVGANAEYAVAVALDLEVIEL